MIIYIEKSQKDNPITQKIINFYKNSNILYIDNYKNLFDKNIPLQPLKSIIIAKVNNSILQSPVWYWHDWEWFFLKNSLNCIYDCKYCYLKWAFKNDIPVFFVNYDDMKTQILQKISEIRKTSNQTIWFYSSDYSDNLATDNLTDFTSNFINFFDNLENVKMEIRTKSTNIWNLLNIKPSKNIEIAFSLNPTEIIQKYELKTTSLDMRIQAINKLLEKNYQVWIRFLPLLEVENYKDIYKKFLEYIVWKIDFDKIYSVFVWWLLYTKQDYNKMLQKQPYLDILYNLEDSWDGFYRENIGVRDFFYNMFDSFIKQKKCNRCLEK